MTTLTRSELQKLYTQYKDAVLLHYPNFNGRNATSESFINVLSSLGILNAKKKSPIKRFSPKKRISSKKEMTKKSTEKSLVGTNEGLEQLLKQDKLINRRWLVEQELGKGGQGIVYRVLDKSKKGVNSAAIKFFINSKNPKDEIEIMFTKLLYPERILDEGIIATKEQEIPFLVMPLYFRSLSDQYHLSPFTLEQVDRLVPVMVHDIEELHNKGIIHRDIKPANFMYITEEDITAKNPNIVLIDLGLAIYYLNKDGTHIAYRTDAPFRGTPRYASINTHSKIESSRRDDLEGLFYTLIALFTPPLPWTQLNLAGLKKGTARKRIKEEKEKYVESEHFKALHQGYQEAYYYIRNLNFEETPDYSYLINLLLKK